MSQNPPFCVKPPKCVPYDVNIVHYQPYMKCSLETLPGDNEDQIVLKIENAPNLYLLQSWSQFTPFANADNRNIILMALSQFILVVDNHNTQKPHNLYKPTILLRKLDMENPNDTEEEIACVKSMYTEGNTNYLVLDKKDIYGCKNNNIFKPNEKYSVSFSLDPLTFGFLNLNSMLTGNNCNLYPTDSGCYLHEPGFYNEAKIDLQYEGGDDFFCNYYFSSEASVKQVGSGIYDIEISDPDNVHYYQIWHQATSDLNKQKKICDKMSLIEFVTAVNNEDYKNYESVLKNLEPDTYFFQPSVAMLLNNQTYFAVIKNMKVDTPIVNGVSQPTKVVIRVSVQQTYFVNQPSFKTYLPTGNFKIDFDVDYSTLKNIYTLTADQGTIFLGEPSDLEEYQEDGMAVVKYNSGSFPVINNLLGIGPNPTDGSEGQWPATRAAVTTPTMVTLFENFTDQNEAVKEATVPNSKEVREGDPNSLVQFKNAESVYVLPVQLPPNATYDDIYWLNEDTQNWLQNTVGIEANFEAIAAIQISYWKETPDKRIGASSLVIGSLKYSRNGVFYSEEAATFAARNWNKQTGMDITRWWGDTSKIYSGSAGPITNSQSHPTSNVMNSGPDAIPDAVMKTDVLINRTLYKVPQSVLDSVKKAGPVQNFYFLNTASEYSFAKVEDPIEGFNPKGFINSQSGEPEFELDETIPWYKPVGPNTNGQLSWLNKDRRYTQTILNQTFGSIHSSNWSNIAILDRATNRNWNEGRVNGFLHYGWLSGLAPRRLNHNLLDFANLHGTPITNFQTLTTPPCSYVGENTNNFGWSIYRPALPYIAFSDLTNYTWKDQTFVFQPGLLYNVTSGSNRAKNSNSPYYTYNMGALFSDPNFEPFATLNEERIYINARDNALGETVNSESTNSDKVYSYTYRAPAVKSRIFQPKPTKRVQEQTPPEESDSFFTKAKDVASVVGTVVSIGKSIISLF